MSKEISFLLIVFIRGILASIPAHSTFFPWRLEKEQDCRAFNSSPHCIARVNGFYHNGNWFMDPEMKIPFITCVNLVSPSDKEARFVIFKIQNMFNYSDRAFVRSIEDMADNIPNYITFIPEINFLMGPNGDPAQVAKEFYNLRGAVVLSAAEKQQTNMAYTKDFFINFFQIQYLRDTIKYIQLNGWHLKNMAEPPHMKFTSFVEAVIIYLEQEDSTRIGLNQIKKYTGHILTTVLYDTHDAMKYLGSDGCLNRMGLGWWLIAGWTVLAMMVRT